MTRTELKKAKYSLITFSVILALFLVVTDSIIIKQQSQALRNEIDSHTTHEFVLFNKLVTDSLTKGDYAAVEEAVVAWGNERNNILELIITADNSFIIANFKRDHRTTEKKRFEGKLKYPVNNTATVTLIKDTSNISAAIQKLSLQLIIFSILLFTLLGFALQRFALRPLQLEIAKHQKTEEKLQQRATELQESNKELESYSYTIAHDLRAPLRSITSFSQIIEEEAQHKLSEEEKEYLKRIITAGKRMANLIDDILELGRVTRSTYEHSSVDLSALAKSIAKRLSDENVDYETKWLIQGGLTATGDKKLLTQLLENLLGNACKFSSKKPHPRVEFGTTNVSRDGKTISAYFIKDNGVGFDMRYAEKIFEPFHRLCTNADFEGTGIGLATVQRVIHRHNGSIWLEATPDKGATFFFTLPANNKTENTRRQTSNL